VIGNSADRHAKLEPEQSAPDCGHGAGAALPRHMQGLVLANRQAHVPRPTAWPLTWP